MKNLVRRSGAIAATFGALGVALSGYHAATNPFEDWPAFNTPGSKLLNHYSYFTLWSNIIGTYICTQYALGKMPPRLAFLRVDAVSMLMITGVIFNTVLAKTSVIEGLLKLTNPIVHTAMPVAMPALWALEKFTSPNPTQDITKRAVWASLAIPTMWAVYAFTRGVITKGYYPYDFMNARTLGYPTAIRNVVGVAGFHAIIVAVMAAVEKAAVKR